jgi:hypothetical protein
LAFSREVYRKTDFSMPDFLDALGFRHVFGLFEQLVKLGHIFTEQKALFFYPPFFL